MTDEVRADRVTTQICKGKFEPDGMVSFLSVQHSSRPLPLKTYYLAGGFLFGPGHILVNVPYDPHLAYLFWGEELLLAARLWTHGYDIFSPAAAVCSHMYERFDKPNVFVDASNAGKSKAMEGQQQIVRDRVKQLLGWAPRTPDQPEMDKYGMGTARSLESYFRESGIDVKKKKVGEHCV